MGIGARGAGNRKTPDRVRPICRSLSSSEGGAVARQVPPQPYFLLSSPEASYLPGEVDASSPYFTDED